jgi:predicted KAP-like P-loop ATPase
MWSDNETSRDFLNFSGVADTVAEIIVQAQGRPISIGVSGAWGVGKSSMIKLTRESLQKRPHDEGDREFIFVEFNAWLYQGYDDARAALMEVIATMLEEEAVKREKGIDKAKDLLKRVNWLRAAKLTAGSALAMALGLPPVGLIGEAWRLGSRVFGEGADQKTVTDVSELGGKLGEEFGGLLKPKPEMTPPREIQALRDSFERALEEMNVTIVVLIDDLDRCLPETTISTLEAIRHFLFLKNAAFVVAADTDMIKHAVRKHFEGVSDDKLVTSYFDKLIQVPIRVPQLGTQEVRAYLMLLFVENSNLDQAVKETIRSKVAEQLRQTWQGKKVDRAFVQTLHAEFPPELLRQLETAERLAPLMTKASGIVGNPRLIKRFLNALSIRMTISRAQGVGVDEAALGKMLLFERLGNADAYKELIVAVTSDGGGKPDFLSDWEERAVRGADLDLKPPWDGEFVREWLTLPPRLAELDLRGVLYVSREYAPLITPEDRLSSTSVELLAALMEHPDMAASLKDRLMKVPKLEADIIMSRLLECAGKEQEWGVPPILNACLVVCESDPSQGKRLAAFLAGRPPQQIQPSIVPKISGTSWHRDVFAEWGRRGVSPAVMRAINKA